MRRTLRDARVLLTGASSGIGRALVLELAARGARLMITARREHLLDELVEEVQTRFSPSSGDGSPRIFRIAGDITSPEIRRRCVSSAVANFGGLDILINNAGVGAAAKIESTEEPIIRRLMEVNVFSLLSMSRHALTHLKAAASDPERQKAGVRPMIVNISSVVGLRGVPHYGVYAATKAAVASLSDSLRAELFQDGIDVMSVFPGTTSTEFFDSQLVASTQPAVPMHKSVSAEYVARRIATGMLRGSHRIIPYFPAVILDYLQRFSPRLVDGIMTRYA